MTEERRNQSLASLTSWRIGGVADRFIRPKSLEGLSVYLKALDPTLPITWLGLGSNVLIRDGGIKGAVISTLDLKQMGVKPSGEVWVQAGVPCAKFARFCCANGFSDAAFFAGIPGTMGGALAMNAGAFGGETWENVVALQVLSRQGELIDRLPAAYDVAYRHVVGKDPAQLLEAFVGATFRFTKTTQDGLTDIRALLRKRQSQQPIGTFNCGSVFRNPPGDHAARLIEACGLKGYQIGGAIVSEKHANFIINTNNATAEDVEQLIETVQSTVLAKTGCQLIKEVRILGEKPCPN